MTRCQLMLVSCHQSKLNMTVTTKYNLTTKYGQILHEMLASTLEDHPSWYLTPSLDLHRAQQIISQKLWPHSTAPALWPVTISFHYITYLTRFHCYSIRVLHLIVLSNCALIIGCCVPEAQTLNFFAQAHLVILTNLVHAAATTDHKYEQEAKLSLG